MEQTVFTDSDGVRWVVREDGADESRSVATVAPPGTAWLRFESELEVRRLWHYPDDWRGLSPMQLESLLDRASTVIARFRPALLRPAAVDDSPGAERQTADVRPARVNGEGPRADPRRLPENEPG